jgi:hypothetical protein
MNDDQKQNGLYVPGPAGWGQRGQKLPSSSSCLLPVPNNKNAVQGRNTHGYLKNTHGYFRHSILITLITGSAAQHQEREFQKFLQ